MKIAILTQPLAHNYGGILQAYALQEYLEKMGHEAQVVCHKGNQRLTFRTVLSIGKRFVKSWSGRNQGPVVPVWLDSKRNKILYGNTDAFIGKYLHTTANTNRFERLNSEGFDAYITGSDQVWRPCYNRYTLDAMFLTFVDNPKAVKISYAASFGVSDWEFSPTQTRMAREALTSFRAVSVREDSGVELCRKYLDREAVQLIDPTMLWDKEDYLSLVPDAEKNNSQNGIFTYIFSSSPGKENLIKKTADYLKDHTFSVYTDAVYNEEYREYVVPPVEKWLEGFHKARFVITDSFHGVVFSILFNKPFFAVGNRQRGLARFDSVLKLFSLEDRLIGENEILTVEKLNDPVDWTTVNQILDRERERSRQFLTMSLLS